MSGIYLDDYSACTDLSKFSIAIYPSQFRSDLDVICSCQNRNIKQDEDQL